MHILLLKETHQDSITKNLYINCGFGNFEFIGVKLLESCNETTVLK
jgi:hypothetical protein